MNKWKTTEYVTTDGRIYRGDFANLEDGAIYAINNRGFTVLTAAQIDQIPVRWADREDIIKFSYQYNTPNRGVVIQIRLF